MKENELMRLLGVAFCKVGNELKSLAQTARKVRAKAPTKPKKATKKDKVLTKPARKVKAEDYAAVKALRKATGKKAWPAARDRLCIRRGLSRRQVNGIMMTIGHGFDKKAGANKKPTTVSKGIPSKPTREMTEIERRSAQKLRKETSDEAWPKARDAFCARAGLTRMQVGGMLGAAYKRKHGIPMGPPKKKVANKK